MQMVNSTALYVLNICEVCGSYQCPYCPFYSAAGLASSSAVALALCTALALLDRWAHDW